ncbi:Sulfhydryl oxidase 2 [Glycine soja]|nr:Sulfhydryl oxidase 2 [Glycine max]
MRSKKEEVRNKKIVRGCELVEARKRCPACRNYKPHYEKVARLFNEPDAVHPGIILIARVDCGLKFSIHKFDVMMHFAAVAYVGESTLDPLNSWSPSQRIINLSTPTPHLRARAGNEHEEHTQIRICVQGLLNRLSESNVKSITGELSLIFQVCHS